MIATPGVNLNYQQSSLNNKNAELFRVLTPVIIMVILIIVIKKLLQGITGTLMSPFEAMGVKDSPAEIAATNQAANHANAMENLGTNSPFSTSYYREKSKGGRKIHLLKPEIAPVLARQIYDAIGFIYDDTDVIISAIKQCQYKTHVSFLSERFATMYKKDLFNFLQEKLDTTNQKIAFGKIVDYVNSLPVGMA